MAIKRKTIVLGTGRAMDVNRHWHQCIYPAKNLGCCVLEFMHRTPTNAKEVEDFLARFDELVSIFREGCIRQLASMLE